MLSNKQIKFISSLQQKKFRKEHHCFVAEGSKLVEELLQSRLECKGVYATGDWIARNQTLQPLKQLEFTQVREDELIRISSMKTPNQALAVFDIPQYSYEPYTARREIVLMLDNLNDPGNLGTILRTADWFGIQHVICSTNSVDLYNPKTVQATMGSISRVRVYYLDLIDVLKNLEKKIPVFGSLLQGKPPGYYSGTQNGMLVIGNEAHGICNALQPFITHPVFIPPCISGIPGVQRPESLNAAVAAAILCWEFRKP